MSEEWQRSSFSEDGTDYLEVRTKDGMVEIRESVSGSIVVRTTPRKWAVFLQGVQAGEFDHFVE